MHITHQNWLKRLADELSVVCSDHINEEANGNMAAYGFDAKILSEWGPDSIDAFLKGCRDLYASKNVYDPLWFYSWFDQLTSQLKISAVSQRHEILPFDCDYTLRERHVLVRGLILGDSGLFTGGSLNVWRSEVY